MAVPCPINTYELLALDGFRFCDKFDIGFWTTFVYLTVYDPPKCGIEDCYFDLNTGAK